MRFEFFRFLLTPVKDPQLPLDGRKLDRSELIDDIFAEKKHYKFKCGKATYGFYVKNKIDSLVHARIGKWTSKKLHSSPENGFQAIQSEDWPGVEVFINLSDEKETGDTFKSGQVIAVQVNKQAINNPTPCLRSLSDEINKKISHHGFYISINPIVSEVRRFWSVVEENKGKIKKIVLKYTPPNLFNLKNKLEDDLREANRTFNTTSTQIVLENEAGSLELPRDNDLLNQSAEYIDQGSGSYSIHLTSGKKTIKSEAGVKTETFEGIELSLEASSKEGLIDLMKTVLGGKS